MQRLVSITMCGLALAAALGGAGCSGSSHAVAAPSTTSGPKVTSAGGTTPTTLDTATFDQGSLNYFPRTSLAKREQLAEQLCNSISVHGDNLLTWLIRANTDKSLFPYDLGATSLGSFTGLAVSYKCPKPAYLAELRQGLAGIPAGVNLGKPSP